MKTKRPTKKKSKKSQLKKLQKENWELCRKIVRLRANNECELCGNQYQLQTDHCFSRANKEIFYNLKNLTLLCSSCHTRKSFNVADVILQVFEHVEAREGTKTFNELRVLSKKKKGFRDWQLVDYHERENRRLQAELTKLLDNESCVLTKQCKHNLRKEKAQKNESAIG